jgi:glutamate/tyrosine decarboxylase-like PLP-dependent enzyme
MISPFDLSPSRRSELLNYLINELEAYYSQTEKLRVTPELNLKKIIQSVRSFDLENPVNEREALDSVLKGMIQHGVHTPHPMYYGLYNPRANMAGIMADLITAVLNPQLAAWSHSPYASEVERYLVEFFGVLFGYEADILDGAFASGGAEANFTAIICALNHRFPEWGEKGLQHLPKRPVIYCSRETHHSIQKGARMAGLGTHAVRTIEVDEQLRMRPEKLRKAILEDKQSGYEPVLVVATAGTTGTGSIDDLEQIGSVCASLKIWFHVDAAYGGAVAVHPEFKTWIKGIQSSDSLIVDLHKWFSVPMAASLFITREPEIMGSAFGINTGYMPGDARDLDITDPFTHSFQWSRRFAGLKIYLSLLMFGKKGYAEVIGKHVQVGNSLRKLLEEDSWSIKNQSPLPVVCFTDETWSDDPGFARAICDRIVASGDAWVSVYPIRQEETLRACITNYQTSEVHLKKLVELLARAREDYRTR